ncbi:unnamed protein product [Trichogramma brassicae]|uniref:Reverse transcriptase domain-containing protein n=1 Tax=Trichogramma brassicae TaxID=86971 RepID=A0A6H5IR45_9HYME|nr:unnamed protein product [Trichogramma brassicae]
MKHELAIATQTINIPLCCNLYKKFLTSQKRTLLDSDQSLCYRDIGRTILARERGRRTGGTRGRMRSRGENWSFTPSRHAQTVAEALAFDSDTERCVTQRSDGVYKPENKYTCALSAFAAKDAKIKGNIASLPAEHNLRLLPGKGAGGQHGHWVPQGSILGLTLWNAIYDTILRLNLPRIVNIVIFADDIALTAVPKHLSQLEKHLNVVVQVRREKKFCIDAKEKKARVLSPLHLLSLIQCSRITNQAAIFFLHFFTQEEKEHQKKVSKWLAREKVETAAAAGATTAKESMRIRGRKTPEFEGENEKKNKKELRDVRASKKTKEQRERRRHDAYVLVRSEQRLYTLHSLHSQSAPPSTTIEQAVRSEQPPQSNKLNVRSRGYIHVTRSLHSQSVTPSIRVEQALRGRDATSEPLTGRRHLSCNLLNPRVDAENGLSVVRRRMLLLCTIYLTVGVHNFRAPRNPLDYRDRHDLLDPRDSPSISVRFPRRRGMPPRCPRVFRFYYVSKYHSKSSGHAGKSRASAYMRAR